MKENVDFVGLKTLERVKKSLEANHMEAYIAADRQEALKLCEQLIPKGAKLSNGGSVTLAQCGIMDLMRRGDYDFLDRDKEGADLDKLFRECFFADYYLCSANAVTEKGEIYQIDGRANRVAAIAYGPKNVLMVVGRNKIVEDIEQARRRARRIAAPMNIRRFSGLTTPCSETGRCADCKSDDRICCTELILYLQREKNRIKVILVNEDLGY